MYSHGQLVSASASTITGGVAVIALPLTSSNLIFQSILVATAMVALATVVVRIVKLITIKRALLG